MLCKLIAVNAAGELDLIRCHASTIDLEILELLRRRIPTVTAVLFERANADDPWTLIFAYRHDDEAFPVREVVA